jgi:hypothetical protein
MLHLELSNVYPAPQMLPFTLKTFNLRMTGSKAGALCETEYARSWSFRAILAMPPISPGNRVINLPINEAKTNHLFRAAGAEGPLGRHRGLEICFDIAGIGWFLHGRNLMSACASSV